MQHWPPARAERRSRARPGRRPGGAQVPARAVRRRGFAATPFFFLTSPTPPQLHPQHDAAPPRRSPRSHPNLAAVIKISALSRITSKAQTSIPRAVRTTLGLREGDSVAYKIEGDRAVLTCVPDADPFTDLFATFTEWAIEADSAYETSLTAGDLV